MDDPVQCIGGLVLLMQELARNAVRHYSAEVEAILRTQNRDAHLAERCLDGMLNFCFDDGMLVLFKKRCRYYNEIDPEATVPYVHT